MKLVWIRNDLRLRDNPALYHACEAARQDGEDVQVVFFITPEQWQSHHESTAKLKFREQALSDLALAFANMGIGMQTFAVDNFADIPEAMLQFCQQHQVTSLFFNEESWFNEKQRDDAVSALLRANGIRCRVFENDLIIGSKYLLSQKAQPYKVFTAWYRLWARRIQQTDIEPLPEPEPLAAPLQVASIEFPNTSAYRDDLWPASETVAQQRLGDFLAHQMVFYGEHRDIPSIRGTSLLSPYFANGLISARDALAQAINTYQSLGLHWEESIWIKELAWREFYRYLMVEFPDLCKHRAFRPETESLVWDNNPEHDVAWQQGNTGFPIIDAAMRQLNQTGWMHNRLRMLVASFYTKLLWLDWRDGERYFMEQLLDGDFASNNGGWQWSASTGCDASPWFRIFNPIKQSEKFDPQGQFIRKFLPELSELSDKQIHFPDQKSRERLGYPLPIIDYSSARKRALDRFGQLSNQQSA